MTASSKIIIGLLSVVALFMGVIAYSLVKPSPVGAEPIFGGGAAAGGSVLALTGSDSKGYALLYLLNTEEESMVVYRLHENNSLGPVSFRTYGQDLLLAPAMMNESQRGEVRGLKSNSRGFRPGDIREKLEALEKKAERKNR